MCCQRCERDGLGSPAERCVSLLSLAGCVDAQTRRKPTFMPHKERVSRHSVSNEPHQSPRSPAEHDGRYSPGSVPERSPPRAGWCTPAYTEKCYHGGRADDASAFCCLPRTAGVTEGFMVACMAATEMLSTHCCFNFDAPLQRRHDRRPSISRRGSLPRSHCGCIQTRHECIPCIVQCVYRRCHERTEVFEARGRQRLSQETEKAF
jgi:hypothetical protein